MENPDFRKVNARVSVSATEEQKPKQGDVALIPAAVTTAVWATLGVLAGRLIGSWGDTKAHGIGTRVGMIVGGLTAGAIALSTTLKRESNDITSGFYRHPEPAAPQLPQPVAATPVALPNAAISDAAHQGNLAENQPELKK